MLISHTNKFIFFKATKVAGTTVESVLALHCGPGDIVTPEDRYSAEVPELSEVRVNGNIPFRWAPWEVATGVFTRAKWPSFAAHDTAKRVKKYLPAELWNTYTKVSVIRNPFDRIISWYYWDQKRGAATGKPFQEYVCEKPARITSYRRQTEIDGNEVVDFYIRFEDLKNDYEALIGRLGLSTSHANLFDRLNLKAGVRPPGRHSREMFKDFPEGVSLIEELCSADLERFGYTWY